MTNTESQSGSRDENKRILTYFLPNKVLGERTHWRGSKEMGKKLECISVFFYIILKPAMKYRVACNWARLQSTHVLQ